MRIISGRYGGRILKTVEGPGYRPAMSRVRESLFSMLEARGVVWEAARVLDLFAGSGSLAFEALSRGAVEALLVESSPQAVRCLQANARLLDLDSSVCRITQDDVLKLTNKACHAPYDVIFMDPPYRKNLFPPAVTTLLRRGWLARDGILCAELEEDFRSGQPPRLQQLADRRFGQTRIILWKNTDTQQPFMPEHSTRSPWDT